MREEQGMRTWFWKWKGMNYGNLLDTLYFLVMGANESSFGGEGCFICLTLGLSIATEHPSYQIGIVSEYLLCVRLF